MPIKTEDYGNVCVITLSGDFTTETTKEVKAIADQRLDGRRHADFVVDFEKADFIDSEGLETLLWLKRRCEDLFGQLKLTHLDDNCRKILEITRLEHRFECHAELAAALKT